ncbi:winged helix-turn-helix transcriptional regulator, partial [bacterium]|nr:winged helix-turn-helix transcriptional regulator [bacterium]
MMPGRTNRDHGSILLGQLAHPERRMIIVALGNRELTFNQLKGILDTSSPNLSQHLRYLRPLITKGKIGYCLSDRGDAALNLLQLFPEGTVQVFGEEEQTAEVTSTLPDVWTRIRLPEVTQSRIETMRLTILFIFGVLTLVGLVVTQFVSISIIRSFYFIETTNNQVEQLLTLFSYYWLFPPIIIASLYAKRTSTEHLFHEITPKIILTTIISLIILIAFTFIPENTAIFSLDFLNLTFAMPGRLSLVIEL